MFQTSIPVSRAGLSPRVRGNHVRGHGDHLGVGSIPACAGEPVDLCHVLPPYRVYPRVCGGTLTRWSRMRRFLGLSPRVRGNHRAPPFGFPLGGSIPACAGEPSFLRSRPRACRVYPRVCGGTAYRSRPLVGLPGLSPRVRGNQRVDLVIVGYGGSIPACAGEPPSYEHGASSSGVYPRVCGGTNSTSPFSPSVAGLSPRVRGNHPKVADRGFWFRSIPACAGEPWTSCPTPHPNWVYPRVCGGTLGD